MVKRSRKKMFAIRLDPEHIEALNEVAKSQGLTTSEVIREFAKNATTLFEIVKQQNERQETERQAFADNLSEWILNNTPETADQAAALAVEAAPSESAP